MWWGALSLFLCSTPELAFGSLYGDVLDQLCLPQIYAETLTINVILCRGKAFKEVRECMCVLSCVQLFATPWTVARQAPLCIGLSRQEYWRRLPSPPPGDLPDSGIELVSPALAGGFLNRFTTWELLNELLRVGPWFNITGILTGRVRKIKKWKRKRHQIALPTSPSISLSLSLHACSVMSNSLPHFGF